VNGIDEERAMTTPQGTIDTRIPGIVLIASSIVALGAMMHHPTAGGADFATFAKNVERVAALNQAVHGTMIVLVGLVTWTVTGFAMRRGLHRPVVLLGLVAWVIGAASMTIAPVFNGFVVVDIARRALASPEISDMLRIALQTVSVGIRVSAVIGAMGMSAAVFFWSADLALARGVARWAGVFGLAAGGGAVIALASGTVRLDVGGMTLVLALWAAWFLAVGSLMILRKV
jgi:hypothetical protein